MTRRVRFYTDYVILDAKDDEDALEQADEQLNRDLDNGWFSLDYEILED